MKPCRLTLLPALWLALSALPAAAQPQNWPAKPLRAIVPFAAGTIVDIIARVVFEQLPAQLGQPITVENRPGAGGTTASGMVAKADPDGYTVLVNSSAHTIAPAFYPSLGYDPARDFAAVIPLGDLPSVLVVPPGRFKSAGDLVAAAKAKPGTLTFASAGVGTATYLSAVRFQFSAGIEAVHVPFKGGPDIWKELIAGRIDFFFAPVGNALALVQDGKVTALAVNGAKRASVLPEVPTTAEAGFANAENPFWVGMFMPAKTPREIVERLHDETLKALQEPKVRDRLKALGVDPMVMTAREFDARVERQIATDAALVRSAGLKAQ